MVSETLQAPVEAPAVPVDPAVPETVVTENPPPEVAAPPDQEPAAADVPEIVVNEPEKPTYITREEWEAEKVKERASAAAEALELDRRRRQTENARKAASDKREIEDRAELTDTVKAAFGAAGVYELPDAAVVTAIDRTVRKREAQIMGQSYVAAESAMDYYTDLMSGKQSELDEAGQDAAQRIGPKLQSFINIARPLIEAKAREGYIAESELPAKVEAEIARRAAKSREGQEELRRPRDGRAPSATSSVMRDIESIDVTTPEGLAAWRANERDFQRRLSGR